MNSSGKKVVLFMLDRVHTIKNGNLLQDYRFIFGTDIHIYTGNPSVLGGISF